MKSAGIASTLALPTTFYVDIKKFAIDKMASKSRCPGPTTIDMSFKIFGARSFVPRIVYFDLESLIVPVAGPEPDNEKLNTHLIEKKPELWVCIRSCRI